MSFRGVDLTSDDLRSLALPPTITYLDIADTEIDDTAIPMLLEMPALATLRLSGSKISSEGVKALRGRKATIAIADYDQDFEDLRALLDSMSGAFEPANSVDSGRGSKAELGRDTDGGPVVEADVAPQLDYQR